MISYLKSEGRRHVLEDILPLFPAWLREAMKPRHMVEIIDGEKHEYADTLCKRIVRDRVVDRAVCVHKHKNVGVART